MGTLQSGHAGDGCGTVPPLRRQLMGVADLTTSMHGSEHSREKADLLLGSRYLPFKRDFTRSVATRSTLLMSASRVVGRLLKSLSRCSKS